LAYDLSGHNIGILTKHDFQVFQDKVAASGEIDIMATNILENIKKTINMKIGRFLTELFVNKNGEDLWFTVYIHSQSA